MRILLSPQVRDGQKIWYEVENETITVTIDGVTDTFDFRGMPDGELRMEDENGDSLVETTLDEVPILNARRVRGELSVELLFSIGLDEDDERLLFPKWLDLSEFNQLMKDIVKRKEDLKQKEKEEENRRRLEDLRIQEIEKMERLAREEKTQHRDMLEDWDDF